MRHKAVMLILFALFVTELKAQKLFKYRRAIFGVDQAGWYTIPLLPDMFSKLNGGLGDLRIYALTGSDTVEVPYVLRIEADEIKHEDVNLQLINESTRDGMLFLTFKLGSSKPVNLLRLEFDRTNYFGRVSVEGSDDRQSWFNIISDQRIVSIDKAGEEFRMSEITFPASVYNYLRVGIASDVALAIKHASLAIHTIDSGTFNDIPLSWDMYAEAKSKNSVVDIKLDHYRPVAGMSVKVSHEGDFYRAVDVLAVADSTRSGSDWIRVYRPVYSGHLSSFEENKIDFPAVFTDRVRLIIHNLDNRPLALSQVSARGPEVSLSANLKPGSNILMYGADDVRGPVYDLVHFQNRIPDSAKVATLEQTAHELARRQDPVPLIQGKVWLWTMMVLMIGLLGFFTVNMMRKSS